MTDNESNDRFEVFVKQAAKTYHEPPPTPRDEMWEAIAEARRAARSTPVIPLRRPSWTRWGMAAAALLALGIAIGRLTKQSEPPPQVVFGTAPSTTNAPGRAYQVATGQHLNQVETLLTSFLVEARVGATDQTLSASARDLLATNRMLIDSRAAARDPQLKQLLDDLELMLAQIVQLSEEKDVDATGLILQSLRNSGVLLRLRANPAARSATNAQGVL